ncbi:MAG TPA: DUF4105 domain-containing protein [Verrucomicrobiae bacterium]|nr:DUF4105 domain-containing protein [Verrucomicrobiae bacterium]
MSQPSKPGLCGRLIRIALRILFGIVMAGMAAWSTAAIYYSNLPGASLRLLAAGAFAIGVIALFVRLRPMWLARCIFLGAFAGIVAWFWWMPPSNNRDWQPDVAVLPYAEINGNIAAIHNIRNCDYRSETDYTVRHYDKTFDLTKLRSVDLYLVTWGSPDIAHMMVSFGFGGGDYVCFSIETRKTKGQDYSAVKGLFRQFTLIYIIADERDVVRLRTNYRQDEEACLYRLQMTPEQGRKLFLDYLRRANELHEHAEWYNAVTDNCTTAVRAQRAAADRAPWDWRMLLNGRLDELLYERGMIATNLPLPELKQLSHINARARAADKDPDFSTRIREKLPGMSAQAPAKTMTQRGTELFTISESRLAPLPY